MYIMLSLISSVSVMSRIGGIERQRGYQNVALHNQEYEFRMGSVSVCSLIFSQDSSVTLSVLFWHLLYRFQCRSLYVPPRLNEEKNCAHKHSFYL